MGLYAKYVLPHMIDLAMQDKETTRIRSEVIPRAHGVVLELGIGSGLNLPFYSDSVRRVYGVDPSLELQKIARKRAATASVAVEFLSQPDIGGECPVCRSSRHLIELGKGGLSRFRFWFISNPAQHPHDIHDCCAHQML